MDKNLAKFLSELKKKALGAGASDATIIDAKIIQDVGWEIYPITRDSDPESISFSRVGAGGLRAVRVAGYSMLDSGIQDIRTDYPVSSSRVCVNRICPSCSQFRL